MKRMQMAAAALLCLVLSAFFGSFLIRYARPMPNSVYDFSLMWEGEAMPDHWAYDQKGWTVFTQEGDQINPLTPDGFGGFYGDIEPNQVFYYSRILAEELDRPVLQVDAFSRSVAVFLDGVPLYSDAGAQDAPIGDVHLPERGWARSEPIALSLPNDYLGKELTIAQNSGVSSMDEPRARFTVYPCAVALYCGHAYEGGLISESFRTAIPAALLFATGLFFLAAFVAGACRGRWNWIFLCVALSALLWMLSLLAGASFFYIYWNALPVDAAYMCRCFSLSVLLALLACRAGRYRAVPWTLAILNAASILLCLIIDLFCDGDANRVSAFLRNESFQLTGFAALVAIMVCAWLFWRKENRFYRLFAPLTALGTAVSLACALLFHGGAFRRQFAFALAFGTPAYFLWPLMTIAALAAVASIAAELAGQEMNRHIEARQMAERNAMAMASYDSLRLQHEQVMMLRHDLAKHLHVLRQMTGETPVAAYLDELIGQNQKIPAILQSGNQMVDIILNGKLASAKAAGIEVEFLHAYAPPALPLCDADLCSLMMNLADNAIAAANHPALNRPWIHMDLCVKGNFFLFTCENAVSEAHMHAQNPSGNGLGLKIVQAIVDRYDILMEVERKAGSYKVTLAIALS